MRGLLTTLLILCCWGAASCNRSEGTTRPVRREVMVFAAASLRDALEAVGHKFELQHPQIHLIFNFAGSNTLARQLLAKPFANVFISANELWMDRLQDAGRLAPGTRRNILGNRLAFVVKSGSELSWRGTADLSELGFRHLVLGDPEAVPAGVYARRYLESVGDDGSSVWAHVQDRLLPMPDVRAALRVVERDPKSVGIVYESDALVSSRVRTLYTVPVDEGPAIVYPAALMKDENSGPSETFLAFLSSAKAQSIFRQFGFVTPATATAAVPAPPSRPAASGEPAAAAKAKTDAPQP
jgi:molybdate transport system substrate-binding protein